MTRDATGAPCPLCDSAGCSLFFRDAARAYRHCSGCDFVFVPPEDRLTEEQEKARYDFHQNRPDDPNYRKFLSGVFVPMVDRLPRGAAGLDFGCGSGPALAAMFAEAGFPMDVYDPHYALHPEVFARRYDFITATEVVEHLRHPGAEMARLFRMLNPGGFIGLMTSLRPDPKSFAAWHYRNDPTHIGFYSRASFDWMAERHRAEIVYFAGNVCIFAAGGNAALDFG